MVVVSSCNPFFFKFHRTAAGSHNHERKMSTPPVADIRPRSSTLHKLFGGSRLWLLTLLCLLISAGLIWWSMPPRGTTIHIQFPEGHGLKQEDTVRYRGIEVGTVESVHLDDSLEGVEVEVLLKPSASELATKGTRFWIVRPELSLTRISGLETAIGHKYIGVSPSDEAAQASYRFQGLADVPVDTLSDSGIELILRGDKKYSVGKGAAVTFRGVAVGTVLDVALSQEARHVDVRVRIFDQHASLLTSETKFWATSGFDFDFQFGLNGGGFDLDTESLETLARGGVSMITIGQGKEVSPGDVFTMHASAEDDWFTYAANFETTDVALRGAAPIKVAYTSSGFFGKKEKVNQFNGVAIFKDGNQRVVFPTDILQDAKKNDQFQVSVGNFDITEQVTSANESILTTVNAKGKFEAFSGPAEFETESLPTDCLVVRRSGDQGVSFHLTIKADSIKLAEDSSHLWEVIDFNGDRNVWHGSPVISSTTGKLIGILLIESRKAKVLTVEGMGL